MLNPPAPPVAVSPSVALPDWAKELVTLYESGAANQFVLYGNVDDRMILPIGGGEMGTLNDFLLKVLLPRFDVILSFDVGNGIRVEKGGPIFTQWPAFKDSPTLPKDPRDAIETLTHYFRYTANLGRLGRGRTQVGLLVRAAQLVAPTPAAVSITTSTRWRF